MIKQVLAVAVVASLTLMSCEKDTTSTSTTVGTVETEQVDDNLQNTQTYTSEDGKTLDMSFDNEKNTATFLFEGETIELEGQPAGSGMWYKNDVYEFRGKGEDVELTKDGKLVFEHKTKILIDTATDDKGNTLKMNFDHDKNEARVVLNDGQEIVMQGQPSAMGKLYTNSDNYELVGQGEEVTLRKDQDVVFTNVK